MIPAPFYPKGSFFYSYTVKYLPADAGYEVLPRTKGAFYSIALYRTKDLNLLSQKPSWYATG